jgi:UDP-N-acetylglucosamine enolpyruvyl transferase
MNAKYFMEDGRSNANGSFTRGHVFFDMSTVGATINVMLAASMADGVTIMKMLPWNRK